MYFSDAGRSGATRLLSSLEEGASVLEEVVPQPGRLLIFPNLYPHEVLPVGAVEKLLTRGEVFMGKS